MLPLVEWIEPACWFCSLWFKFMVCTIKQTPKELLLLVISLTL